MLNLSGRGDKDVATVAAHLGTRRFEHGAHRRPLRRAEGARAAPAFVAYVMAGDPDAATALAILKGLPAAGADLIELGFPFSDPMAEGPPIQRAAQRALARRHDARRDAGAGRARFREGDHDHADRS